jgi:hypothetical protein
MGVLPGMWLRGWRGVIGVNYRRMPLCSVWSIKEFFTNKFIQLIFFSISWIISKL